jgi:hypothetical protein
LPPMAFEIEVPAGYQSSLHPPGGFYLQLVKLSGDTILQEISFGQADSLRTDEQITTRLAFIDSSLSKAFTDHGQKYKTDFRGVDEFLGRQTPQVRSTINLRMVPRDTMLIIGDYSSFMSCAYSKSKPDHAMMVSVLSSLKEETDPRSKLGLSAVEILKTLRVF